MVYKYFLLMFKFLKTNKLNTKKNSVVSLSLHLSYNKTREDFDSLENYNDYLEEKEAIKYNLENGIDKDATKLKVKQYQNAHREEIVANKARDLDTRRMIEQVGWLVV